MRGWSPRRYATAPPKKARITSARFETSSSHWSECPKKVRKTTFNTTIVKSPRSAAVTTASRPKLTSPATAPTVGRSMRSAVSLATGPARSRGPSVLSSVELTNLQKPVLGDPLEALSVEDLVDRGLAVGAREVL